MRSFRRAYALLAASAPLAVSVACGDPELKSELVTEGPPEVVQVNVLSEAPDPTHLLLGEQATFCRPGTEYKVNNVYCPEERDANNAPIPGAREVEPHAFTTPFGPVLGYTSIWHVRLIFDELLNPDVEDLVEVDGQVFGTLAETQPVTVTCNDTEVAYDGFYDPSGNHLSYPPGPALVIQSQEFVATSSNCQVEIKGGAVEDKDGNEVPADQRGPYAFSISPLAVYGTSPADTEEGVAPTATIDVEFNAPIDVDTVAANVTVEDADGNPVAFTVALAPVDPADPAAGEIPNIVSIIPNAPLAEGTAYTVTISSNIADIAGGALVLDEPIVVTFTTGTAA